MLLIALLVFNTQSFAQFKLTVLHNNDGESKLLNAGTGNLANFGGVSRFKTVLDTLRAQSNAMNVPAIMLASGDNTLAGPEFYLSQQLPFGTPFYDVVAMNSFDYDAICTATMTLILDRTCLQGSSEIFSLSRKLRGSAQMLTFPEKIVSTFS
ncbi:MAG: hypothetical protein IPG99_09125 [Ignavibacteria bacterium]|nr:hypothetical protein [Ignavibacteria bacterium]